MDNLAVDMTRALAMHESQLRTTSANVTILTRKNTLITKTIEELKSQNKPSVWESIGRTFVEVPLEKYLEKLNGEIKDNVENLNNLNKKKHYLETSIETTRDSLSKLKLMNN